MCLCYKSDYLFLVWAFTFTGKAECDITFTSKMVKNIYIYISHHIDITTPMPRPGVPVGAKKNFSKGGTKVLANLELLENNLLNWFILY